jgi:hypothetical protein
MQFSNISKNTDVQEIKDDKTLLILIVVTFLPWPIIFLLFYYGLGYLNLLIIVSMLVLSIIFFLILRANWDGYIINLQLKTLELPGGGFETNNVTDYLSPKYWLQSVRRITISLEDIQNIEATELIGANNINTLFILRIVGKFGAVRIIFKQQGKRDQLYASLREINKMGSPVLNI